MERGWCGVVSMSRPKNVDNYPCWRHWYNKRLVEPDMEKHTAVVHVWEQISASKTLWVIVREYTQHRPITDIETDIHLTGNLKDHHTRAATNGYTRPWHTHLWSMSTDMHVYGYVTMQRVIRIYTYAGTYLKDHHTRATMNGYTRTWHTHLWSMSTDMHVYGYVTMQRVIRIYTYAGTYLKDHHTRATMNGYTRTWHTHLWSM